MTNKRYRKEFYFSESKLSYIVLTWETGFKHFQVFYNQNLIQEINDFDQLKKGVNIADNNVGNLYLKLMTNPLNFIVKAGDQYLGNSYIPELKKISVTTKIINLIAVICVISGVGEFLSDLFSYYGIKNYLELITYWQFYLGVSLLVSIRFIKKGYLFLFMLDILIIGSGILYLFTQFLKSTEASSLENIVLGSILYSIGIFMLIFMFGNIKAMFTLHKNKLAWKNIETKNSDILDDY